jgi:hypothetical protein
MIYIGVILIIIGSAFIIAPRIILYVFHFQKEFSRFIRQIVRIIGIIAIIVGSLMI